MNLILYFQSPLKTSAPEKLLGAQSAARKLKWRLQTVESKPTRKSVGELIDFWRPAGAIVDCGRDWNNLDIACFRGLPTVFISHDPENLPPSAFAVMNSQEETSRLAARELLMTGHTAFAFIPNAANSHWSRLRQKTFVKAIEMNGYSCRVPELSNVTGARRRRLLRNFLCSLPRPSAIFAANDETASEVATIAELCHIAIPSEIALLGVDNFLPICEGSAPQLSSIMTDFHRGGELAALLLAAQLRDGRHFRGSRIRYFGPLRVVRRASTRILQRADREVESALKLIHEKACEGLSAADVCATFGCSRRSADMRFRATCGHSILEEIHSIRLARCQDLIRNGVALKALHDFCGFSSAHALRQFFLRETGFSMSAWRKKAAEEQLRPHS